MTPEQIFEGGTNTYNNWIEFGVGGFLTKGNKSQVQQRNQNSGGVFGGIEDLHHPAEHRQGHDDDHGRAGHLRRARLQAEPGG